jgi:hypothetical protein
VKNSPAISKWCERVNNNEAIIQNCKEEDQKSIVVVPDWIGVLGVLDLNDDLCDEDIDGCCGRLYKGDSSVGGIELGSCWGPDDDRMDLPE